MSSYDAVAGLAADARGDATGVAEIPPEKSEVVSFALVLALPVGHTE
jgi:hypothetical protein